MRCRGAKRIMQAALDGEIAARERTALEAHLAGCAGCRTAMTELGRLSAALAGLPARDHVPAGLEEATWRRIRGEQTAPARRRGVGEVFGLSWWWVPVPAVAALVAVALLRPGASPQRPAAPARVAEVPVAEPSGAPAQVASRERAEAPARTGAPATQAVPPAVVASVDLYLDLPILENMEKLENYDAILTMEDGRDRNGEGSRG